MCVQLIIVNKLFNVLRKPSLTMSNFFSQLPKQGFALLDWETLDYIYAHQYYIIRTNVTFQGKKHYEDESVS